MIARLLGLATVSPAELLPLVRAGRVTVLDVNPRSSWASARVPGARHADPDAFGPEALPADKASTVVFYCSNPMCTKAPRAAKRAEKMGYGDVRVLSAGIRGWLAARLPVESGD